MICFFNWLIIGNFIILITLIRTDEALRHPLRAAPTNRITTTTELSVCSPTTPSLASQNVAKMMKKENGAYVFHGFFQVA